MKRSEPIGSNDITDYISQLSNNQARKQIENVAIEENIAGYWIKELQRINDVTKKINIKLTKYSVRMGNLKTVLENRLGIRMPRFEQGPENELVKYYVNKETQTEGINVVENNS